MEESLLMIEKTLDQSLKMKKMQSLLPAMGLLVLGLTLSACTTSSSQAPASPELETSNPLVESLEKEEAK